MSLQHWEAGSAPSPAQPVKDPALLQLQCRQQLQLGASDPCPRNSICPRVAKKEKKEKRETDRQTRQKKKKKKKQKKWDLKKIILSWVGFNRARVVNLAKHVAHYFRSIKRPTTPEPPLPDLPVRMPKSPPCLVSWVSNSLDKIAITSLA